MKVFWNDAQYETYVKQLQAANEMYLKERNECIAKLNIPVINETELETFWNNKRPKSDIKYGARPAILTGVNNLQVDPRIFFVNDPSLPDLKGESNDKTALACQQYVISKITYTTDTKQFKDSEVWLFPFETIALKKGDCEDGAILMANLMLRAGIPYWRIRINAGNVKVSPTSSTGGHAYVTYLREKDNKWYLLDWCFFPDLNFGALFKDSQKYYDVWFSFNQKYIYSDEQFERTTNSRGTGKAKAKSR